MQEVNSYIAELSKRAGRKRYDINIVYHSPQMDHIDGKAKYLRMKKGDNTRQDDKIIAPMPGKVVKIPVKKGDHLQAGDIVIVLEAMKMQSNYKVNSECVVKDILVNEGDSVNGNQTLILLDIIAND